MRKSKLKNETCSQMAVCAWCQCLLAMNVKISDSHESKFGTVIDGLPKMHKLQILLLKNECIFYLLKQYHMNIQVMSMVFSFIMLQYANAENTWLL
jgi:hypothetical protein